MKTLLLTFFLLIAAAVLPLSAQEFTATLQSDRDLRQLERPAPAEGALQSAVRRGRVLQTIVPDANAESGNGEKFVAYEEGDPFLTKQGRPRPLGIRLLTFAIW